MKSETGCHHRIHTTTDVKDIFRKSTKEAFSSATEPISSTITLIPSISSSTLRTSSSGGSTGPSSFVASLNKMMIPELSCSEKEESWDVEYPKKMPSLTASLFRRRKSGCQRFHLDPHPYRKCSRSFVTVALTIVLMVLIFSYFSGPYRYNSIAISTKLEKQLPSYNMYHIHVHLPPRVVYFPSSFTSQTSIPLPQLTSSQRVENEFKFSSNNHNENDNEDDDSLLPSNWDKDCVLKTKWQSTFYPTCNSMHEINLISSQTDLISSGGSWRLTWKFMIPPPLSQLFKDPTDTFVLKMLRIDREFNAISFEHNRVDSIALERLTSSPHVLNQYSFCGQSVITDFAAGNSNSLIKQKRLQPMDRLYLAKNLLEGLAHIHGIDYPDGNNATLIHNDINPANIVQVNNSALMFNDFNIGILPRWDPVKNQQCYFPATYENNVWRSPEEIMNKTFGTEKVDVYSLGNLMFQLLTTREPWNHLEPGGRRPTDDEIVKRKKAGGLPFIPESLTESDDPAIQVLYMATLSCYTFDLEKRPSARIIADQVNAAIQMIEEKNHIKKKHLLRIFNA